MTPNIETLREYEQYTPGNAAALLGVAPSTYLRWRKQLGLKIYKQAGLRWAPGELPGSLAQSIMARGPDNFKDMTAEEIATEFGVDIRHVRGTARKFGFTYRHLKRGRKRNV